MNMKLTKGLLGLGAMLIASQASAAVIPATGATVDMLFNPTPPVLTLGDTLTVSVSAAGFSNGVSGAGVSMTWDSSLIVDTVTYAPGWGPFLFPPVPVTGANNSGQIDIDFANFAGDGLLGATFDLATVTFIAAPPPTANGTINFGLEAFNAWQSADIPTNTYNMADVTFPASQSFTVNAVPVPAAVWLFGSGLIGLVGVARRKTQLA